MTLGEKLYTLRAKRNMTQEQLAEKSQNMETDCHRVWYRVPGTDSRPDCGHGKLFCQIKQSLRSDCTEIRSDLCKQRF